MRCQTIYAHVLGGRVPGHDFDMLNFDVWSGLLQQESTVEKPSRVESIAEGVAAECLGW